MIAQKNEAHGPPAVAAGSAEATAVRTTLLVARAVAECRDLHGAGQSIEAIRGCKKLDAKNAYVGMKATRWKKNPGWV